jgi:hypothetical protein
LLEATTDLLDPVVVMFGLAPVVQYLPGSAAAIVSASRCWMVAMCGLPENSPRQLNLRSIGIR